MTEKINSLGHIPRYRAPSSWWEHVPVAHLLIEKIRPDIVVELGTHYGVSYFSFCEAAENYSPVTRVYAIDTWEGDEQAGFYGEEIYQMVEDHRVEFHEGRGKLLRSKFDDAASEFCNGSIDIVHFDGLHTYDAVKNDFDMWLPKIKEGGTLIFHDWNERGNGFGVWRLWDEIKSSKDFYCLEFANGHGLGIATLKSNQCIPEWHKLIEENKTLLTGKGKILNMLQDKSDELKAGNEEKNILLKHTENLEEILREKDKHIDSLKMELKRQERVD